MQRSIPAAAVIFGMALASPAAAAAADPYPVKPVRIVVLIKEAGVKIE